MKYASLLMGFALASLVAFAAETYPEISTAELKKAIQEKKVTLIDVNGTESWREGHIPGALNYEEVSSKLAAKLPADKQALVVAYCGNEQCPAYRAGAQAAVKLGYKNVKHYAKGIQGWTKLGEATEKGK